MNSCYRPHSTIKNLYCFCLFIFVIFSLCCCQKEPDRPAISPEKITIAHPRTFYAVLFQIAFVKGFFREEGLDVVAQSYAIGRDALGSVIDGKADLAVSSDTSVMFAVLNGRKINIVAVIATSRRNEAIVAWKDRGIKKPADLEGKRVGVAFGTTAHFFLDSFLTAHKVDKKQVSVFDTKPEELSDALMKKKVDAVTIWNPHLKKLERQLGKRGTVFYDECIYSDVVCVSGLREYVRKHPETIKKVLRALLKAEAFAKQNPDESRRIFAESMKVDKTIIDEAWDCVSFKVTLDQFLLVNLEDETRWARQYRLTGGEEKPNYIDVIYTDGLKSVKPDAVRIIR